MSEVEKRIAELANRGGDDLCHSERSALVYLRNAGYEDLASVIRCEGKERYPVWAAESIVWTCRRLRAKEWREAVRGMAQIFEYKGRNGGFLPAGLSDHANMISNYIQDVISGRKL